MDRVIKDRIVLFMFVVNLFLLVGLLAMLGWLEAIDRFLGALIDHLMLLLTIQGIASWQRPP